MLNRDLSRESSVWLVEDILSCDFDSFAEVLAGEEQVEGWWCDNNFSVGVELCVVEVGNNLLDFGNAAIPGRVSVCC